MSEGETITLFQFHSPDAPARDITMPRELGPVRLIREIGRGGMGVVYLGRHELLHRDVAVKFLLNVVTGTDDPGFQRFLDEGRAAAAVRHPALTVVYHADLIENVPYLVIEYVNGPALSEVIGQSGCLSLAATLAVLDPVTQAIAALHAKAIIHRDIKPSNVLLDADARVLVTDFGLACARRPAKEDASTLRLAGTPAYMAPEMFDGTVSPQSDVYALGILTFELLTGGLPFTGPLEEIREKHLRNPVPLDPLRERGVDSALIELVERATHKKAMFRFKRAEHFQRALRDRVTTDELLMSGATELKHIVFKLHERGPVEGPVETAKEPSTSTYFERLSELADKKRTTCESLVRPEGSSEEPVGSEPATRSPRAETTDTGGESADVDEVPSSGDIPCAHCGYNLRGLPEGGRCPECGTPIAKSLGGDLLSAADPAWLKRVYRGQALVYAGCVALVTHVFLYNVSSSGVSPGSWVVVHALGASSVVDTVLEAVLSAAVALLLLLGAFTTTALDPRLSLTEQPIALRRFVRGSIVALVALAGAGYLVPTVVKQLGADAEVASLCATVLLYASGLVFLSALVSICYYLAALATRIPDAKLATRTRSKVVRFVVCIGISGVARVILGLVRAAFPTNPSIELALIPISILALAALAYIFSLMNLMSAYRKAFRKCLFEAREHAGAQERSSGIIRTIGRWLWND